MRKSTLLACLCVAASAFAGNNAIQSSNTGVLAPKITKPSAQPYAPEGGRLASSLKSKMKTEAAERLGAGRMQGLYDGPQQLRKMAVEAQKKKQKLDSVVCTTNSTGEKVSIQTFSYYDNNLPKERINSLWNAATGQYEPMEYYGYTWDDDGYCLVQYGYSDVYNSGQKYEYTYNDRKLGISQVISNYDNGSWVLSQKGEYKYDQWGNIIEEHTYVYEDGAWKNANWNLATWDENGRQTSYEAHYWNGTGWDYSQDHMDYAYDSDGHQLLWSFNKYVPETKSWLNYYRIEQTFNDRGLMTMQEAKFWNKDTQTWDGVYDWGLGLCYNYRTTISYDNLDRPLLERAMNSYEVGKYVKGCDNVSEYTTTDDGGYESVRKTLMYNADGETTYLNGVLTKRYDKRGNVTFVSEKKQNGDIMPMLYDENYEYDDDGYMTASKSYRYDSDEANKRYADIAETIIYDDNHNIIDSYYDTGQGTGEDDWQKTTRFTYAFEHDTVRVEKKAYVWNGSEYAPNWGEGITFDYSTPVSDLALWIGNVPYHKIMETMSYVANGLDWDWNSFKYFYSDTGTTGLDGVKTAKGISVYPRVVTDVLNVSADGAVSVRLYGSDGSLVLVSDKNVVGVGNLPKGIYIVDVNGSYKAKIVKR